MQSGLALDVDDTISDTFPHFAREVFRRFGAPEGMTVEKIVSEYNIMPNVPFWQTKDIHDWLRVQANSNEAQEAIETVPSAREYVRKIHEVIPIVLYITSRPTAVAEGTKRWLEKNGFPDAELITRPEAFDRMNGNVWKAEIIERRKSIVGLIDDNPEIISAFSGSYKGTVYLFAAETAETAGSVRVVTCPAWPDVYAAILKDQAAGRLA